MTSLINDVYNKIELDNDKIGNQIYMNNIFVELVVAPTLLHLYPAKSLIKESI